MEELFGAVFICLFAPLNIFSFLTISNKSTFYKTLGARLSFTVAPKKRSGIGSWQCQSFGTVDVQRTYFWHKGPFLVPKRSYSYPTFFRKKWIFLKGKSFLSKMQILHKDLQQQSLKLNFECLYLEKNFRKIYIQILSQIASGSKNHSFVPLYA